MENSGLQEMSGPVNTVRQGTFCIACCNEAGNAGLPFVGAIDDVRVFNRELSAEEVLALYNIPTPPPSPAVKPGPLGKLIGTGSEKPLG
jgi:hypothetical protein